MLNCLISYSIIFVSKCNLSTCKKPKIKKFIMLFEILFTLLLDTFNFLTSIKLW